MDLTFAHLHSSNWYGSSPAQLHKAVTRYIRLGYDLITLTEVEAEAREDVLRSFEGWGAWTGDLGNRNDCAIMWDQSVWRLEFRENAPITNMTSPRAGGGRTDRVAATLAVLVHISTGYTLLLTDAHMPSSVQSRGGLTKGQRGAVWLSCAYGWRKLWNKRARQYGVDAVMAVADWNIDLRLLWARLLMKSTFPTMKSTWGTNFPPRARVLTEEVE
jgi:hypothetical protein